MPNETAPHGPAPSPAPAPQDTAPAPQDTSPAAQRTAPHDPVLCGLARNPALSPALLRRLLRHRTARGRAAHERTDLTAETAEAVLASGDDWAAYCLAANRHAPAEARSRLVRGADALVRTVLAGRPEDLTADEAALLAEDPSAEVRKALAAADGTPGPLRAGLAADPDPAVRAELARWWTDAPEEVRRRLLTDEAAEVRAAACAVNAPRPPRPVPPADLHGALLADPVTRAGVVAHLRLDEALAERLAADPDEEVRAALAEHPALPAAVRDALAADPAPDVRVRVFLREDTPQALRAAVHTGLTAGAAEGAGGAFAVTEEGLSCEIALAALRFTLVPWVRADPLPYAASPYVCFRRSAAAARDLPPGARESLLDDPDALVRHTAAAAAPVLSPEAAERAERRHRRGGETRGGPADHAVFPAGTLRRFAGDPDARIRVLALRDPELPAALVARLAADDETPVRRAAASHPALPVPALLALVTDGEEDPEVREEAAASPVLPVSDMADLLTLARL